MLLIFEKKHETINTVSNKITSLSNELIVYESISYVLALSERQKSTSTILKMCENNAIREYVRWAHTA